MDRDEMVSRFIMDSKSQGKSGRTCGNISHRITRQSVTPIRAKLVLP